MKRWLDVLIPGALLPIAVSSCGFTRLDYLIDPLLPCLVILLVYLSSSLLAYLKTEQENGS